MPLFLVRSICLPKPNEDFSNKRAVAIGNLILLQSMISRSYNFLCSAGSKSVRCRLGQLRGPRGVRGAVRGAAGGGAGGERQEVPGAQDAGHRAGQGPGHGAVQGRVCRGLRLVIDIRWIISTVVDTVQGDP